MAVTSPLYGSFDSCYANGLYVSDELAKPYVAAFGPGLRNDHAPQNRVSLTRLISDRIEIGIVWGVRSQLSTIDSFGFERQTIGAMLRFVR
jgi:hypothetical protein